MLDSFGITAREALVILGGVLIAFVIVGSSMIQSVIDSRLFGEAISEKLFRSINIIDD